MYGVDVDWSIWEMAGNAKKWLLGCGGCLGVVVLLTLVVVVAGVMFGNTFFGGNSPYVKAIFGDKPPENYFTVGFPITEKGETTNLVVMASPNGNSAMFAVDFALSPSDVETLRTEGSDKIASIVESYLKQGLEKSSSSDSTQKQSSNESFMINSDHQVTLANGKQTTSLLMKIDNEDGTYSPAVAILLLHPNNRMVTVAALDVNNQSSNPDSDFDYAYENLETEVLSIINHSVLAERMEEL